jgi:drug/metabolite transporter (DMT)-like permease
MGAGWHHVDVNRTSWMLLWALALLWGASYLFIKWGLEGVEPVFLVWARLVLAAAVLIPLAARAGALRGLPVGPIALLALIQVVGPFLLITFGEERIASGLTGILVASAPLFTALLGMVGFGSERISGWSFAGVLVGLGGVAMLFGVDLTGSSTALIGGIMVLGAAFGYAVGAIYLRTHLSGHQSIGVAAASMTASALWLTVPTAFFVPDAVPEFKPLAAIVVLGIGGTGVAFAIFYRLISTVGANKASVVAYLAPGFSVGYGAWLLDEPVTTGAIGGLTLILLGSWTAAEGRPPWRPKPAPAPVPATG